jgi:hypothetical protein
VENKRGAKKNGMIAEIKIFCSQQHKTSIMRKVKKWKMSLSVFIV